MKERHRARKVAIACALGAVTVLGLSSCSSVMSDAKQLMNDSEYQPETPLSEMIQSIKVAEVDPQQLSSMNSSAILSDETPFGEATEGQDAESILPPTTAYSAVLFPHWIRATDKMGWPKGTNTNCSSRWAAMYRDGEGLKWLDEGSCVLDEGGSWTDDYGTKNDSGDLEDPISGGNTMKFEVDHIIQTRVAWLHGAQEWDIRKRELFANDPLNLQTTSTKAMYQKNAESASSYIPPGKFQCEYASRYVQVAHKFDLSVSQADKDALESKLKDCGAI